MSVSHAAQVERKDLAWERWYDLSSQEIGELIKAPKIGKQLHRMIHEFPRLELAAQARAETFELAVAHQLHCLQCSEGPQTVLCPHEVVHGDAMMIFLTRDEAS